MRIISGNFKGKTIFQPKDKSTRPLKDLTKESIFNIIEHSNLFNIKIEKSHILDLFSGVGSFGLECVSRGALSVTFFENYKKVLPILKKNIFNIDLFKISKIVDQQKEGIDDRTKELKEKNKELAEISQLNAHTVREPLSRILGLIEISDYYSAEELKTEVLDHLKTSSEDLDKALKDVIERSAKAIELFSSKSPQ
mgnify:CR=1 FL=1